LFGVESGVTSILTRFNKETTGEQNALAVRTLSALGVPTRFTYITFDQLMSADELHATCAFQARTDLLLRSLPHLSVVEIVDGVRDETFVAEHATGQPFYTGISYPLVSMECLIGAAYTRQVQAAGLAGPALPAMGRLDAEFADWRIGRFAHYGQLWVDRHFALDYTLKSLEKILDGQSRYSVRAARVVFKDAAFGLLTAMADLLPYYAGDQPDAPVLDGAITALMNTQIDQLHPHVATMVNDLGTILRASDARLLFSEYEPVGHSHVLAADQRRRPLRHLNLRSELARCSAGWRSSGGLGDGHPVELGTEPRVGHQLPLRVLVHPARRAQQMLDPGVRDPLALGHVRLDVIEHPARHREVLLRQRGQIDVHAIHGEGEHQPRSRARAALRAFGGREPCDPFAFERGVPSQRRDQPVPPLDRIPNSQVQVAALQVQP